MYFIELTTKDGQVKLELNTTVTYDSSITLYDFPKLEFDDCSPPICHSVKLISSIELLNDEHHFTEDVERQILEKYSVMEMS